MEVVAYVVVETGVTGACVSYNNASTPLRDAEGAVCCKGCLGFVLCDPPSKKACVGTGPRVDNEAGWYIARNGKAPPPPPCWSQEKAPQLSEASDIV